MNRYLRALVSSEPQVKLIVAISAMYVLQCVAWLVSSFGEPIVRTSMEEWLALSSSVGDLIYRPWTVLSYAFIHEGFIHLIINVIFLHFAAMLFCQVASERAVVPLFVIGAVMGAVAFVAAYAIKSRGMEYELYGWLAGSSAAVLALMSASGVIAPHMPVRMTFVGEVRMMYVVMVCVGISLLGLFGANWAGVMSHLGGAVAGVVYGLLLRRGVDIARPIRKILDVIENIPNAIQSNRKRPKLYVSYRKGDDESCDQHQSQDERLDEILEKIKLRGFDSLSSAEREFLERYSKS